MLADARACSAALPVIPPPATPSWAAARYKALARGPTAAVDAEFSGAASAGARYATPTDCRDERGERDAADEDALVGCLADGGACPAPWLMGGSVGTAACSVWARHFLPLTRDIAYLILCVPTAFNHQRMSMMGTHYGCVAGDGTDTGWDRKVRDVTKHMPELFVSAAISSLVAHRHALRVQPQEVLCSVKPYLELVGMESCLNVWVPRVMCALQTYCAALRRMVALLERYELWNTLAAILQHAAATSVYLQYRGRALQEGSISPESLRALLRGGKADDISVRYVAEPMAGRAGPTGAMSVPIGVGAARADGGAAAAAFACGSCPDAPLSPDKNPLHAVLAGRGSEEARTSPRRPRAAAAAGGGWASRWRRLSAGEPQEAGGTLPNINSGDTLHLSAASQASQASSSAPASDGGTPRAARRRRASVTMLNPHASDSLLTSHPSLSHLAYSISNPIPATNHVSAPLPGSMHAGGEKIPWRLLNAYASAGGRSHDKAVDDTFSACSNFTCGSSIDSYAECLVGPLGKEYVGDEMTGYLDGPWGEAVRRRSGGGGARRSMGVDGRAPLKSAGAASQPAHPKPRTSNGSDGAHTSQYALQAAHAKAEPTVAHVFTSLLRGLTDCGGLSHAPKGAQGASATGDAGGAQAAWWDPLLAYVPQRGDHSVVGRPQSSSALSYLHGTCKSHCSRHANTHNVKSAPQYSTQTAPVSSCLRTGSKLTVFCCVVCICAVCVRADVDSGGSWHSRVFLEQLALIVLCVALLLCLYW